MGAARAKTTSRLRNYGPEEWYYGLKFLTSYIRPIPYLVRSLIVHGAYHVLPIARGGSWEYICKPTVLQRQPL